MSDVVDETVAEVEQLARRARVVVSLGCTAAFCLGYAFADGNSPRVMGELLTAISAYDQRQAELDEREDDLDDKEQLIGLAARVIAGGDAELRAGPMLEEALEGDGEWITPLPAPPDAPPTDEPTEDAI